MADTPWLVNTLEGLAPYVNVINEDIKWFHKMGKQESLTMFNFAKYEELANPDKLRAIGEGLESVINEDKQIRFKSKRNMTVEAPKIRANTKSDYAGTYKKPDGKYKTEEFYLIVRLTWAPEEAKEEVPPQQ
jgi:hypothetical protein